MKGRTYRYFDGDVLFPFGYGLSYSEFYYRPATIKSDNGNIAISGSLGCDCDMLGREVIQLYCTYPKMGGDDPIKSLVGVYSLDFNAIYEDPPTLRGPARCYTDYEILLDMDFLKRWDTEAKEYYLPKGEYTFYIGSSSEDIRIEIPYEIE
jgi:beta-glucosidase